MSGRPIAFAATYLLGLKSSLISCSTAPKMPIKAFLQSEEPLPQIHVPGVPVSLWEMNPSNGG